MQCVFCEDKPEMAPGVARDHVVVSGRTFEAELPGLVCSKCHNAYFAADDQRSFELAVAIELAKHPGIDGEGFRYMRKAAGLSASDLSELLDMSAEHISRMENGKKGVEKRTQALLGLICSDVQEKCDTAHSILRALARPDDGPKTVKVVVPPRKPDF